MPRTATLKTVHLDVTSGTKLTLTLISCQVAQCKRHFLSYATGRNADTALHASGWGMCRGAYFCPDCLPTAREQSRELRGLDS